MRCLWIRTILIAMCFALPLVESFGEILMTRCFLQSREVNYTCVSKDDGAALIWNDDLRLNSSDRKKFLPIHYRKIAECGIAKADGCFALWENTNDWKLVDSLDHPMGPVFDSRWEDFEETSFPWNNVNGDFHHVKNIKRSGAIVFSARSAGTIQLKLCPDNNPSRSSCYGVIIEPKSPQDIENNKYYTASKFSEEFCDGNVTQSVLHNSLISEHEWRTFVFQWDENLKRIKAYEVSQPELIIKNETHNQWKDLKHLFLQSSGPGRVRFHLYKYWSTTKEGSKLSTNQFAYNEENFCIELVVALCSSCKLEVRAVNSKIEGLIIGNISGINERMNSELLTWQVVKLNKTLSKDYQHFTKLEIVTRMNRGSQGQWAIGNLRRCQSVDAVRQSTISVSIKKLKSPSQCYTPITRCQRLSNNGTAIVSSRAQYASNISNELLECLRDRGDPSCKFRSTKSCKTMSVCNPSGCICAPGFIGDNCNKACSDGRHGYYCKKHCKSCKNGICDKSKGSCIDGCNNDLLPPYCKKKWRKPDVRSITDTTALVDCDADLILEEEIELHFRIKKVNGQWYNTSACSRKSTVQRITDLQPSTKYNIQAVVISKGTQGAPSVGPEESFTTKCMAPSVPLKLNITTQGRGVVLLEWNQPQYSSAKDLRFEINVYFMKTRLSKNFKHIPTNEITTDYRLTFNLHTSTKYNFSVTAISKCGRSPVATKVYHVPRNIGFPNREKMVVIRNGTFITVTIPSMVNTTRNSLAKIIVKGSPNCTIESSLETVPGDLKKLINMTDSDVGWIAATFPAQESGPKHLTIGNDPATNTSRNCHLSPKKSYMVMVVVFDKFDNTSDLITSSTISPIYSSYNATREIANLIWLVIVPIMLLLACLLMLFCCYRRRKSSRARMKSLPFVEYVDGSSTMTPDDSVFDCYPHPAKLKMFEQQVQMAVQNGELESEFAMLPKGLVQTCYYGNLPENKSKNRYGNLIAYDETLVILKNQTGEFHSEYINANYIQGYHKERAYIATQGPKSNTIVDFWRMIWQEEVRVICMLVNLIEDGEKMCERYWPKLGRTVKYGHIAILNMNQRVYADYTYRTFQLSTHHETESRIVEHLQYTNWPRTGVPMYSHSIVEYLNELRAIDPGPGPIVVHCNVGTGRTGTIILCDICLNYIAAEGTVNLFAEAEKMYSARANMLDNLQQYILAHLMPTQCLLLLPTKLPCSDVSLEKIEELKTDLPSHIRILEASSWKDKALYPLESLTLPNPEHLAKNRFPTFTPVKHSLVKLKRYPIHDSSSDYISAISVDGVRVEKQFLASQLPLPSTLSDFWRLVAEQKVELVIILQRPDPTDSSCIDIIPGETTLNPVPFITVKNRKISDCNEHFTTDHLLLTDTSEEQARIQNVTVLTCINWNLAEGAQPPSPETLVALWSASERVSRTEGPTLVLCHDGVTGCGLYIALSILLERMNVEQECDVILAVRVARRSRAEFVHSKAQFEYLYDAAVHFAEGFKTYSNFT